MSFQSLTASRAAVSSTTPAVAPASSAAPATTSSRPATTSAAALPTTQAAVTTPATTAAATTAAAATTSAAAPVVAASSSAAPAVSSAAASTTPASSSAGSSASSAATSSSSAAQSITSSSSASSSASRSSSASSSIASFVGSTAQTTGGSSSTLPGSTIGAIAGGVAGGLLLIALVFAGWRRMKGRRDRVPPPPPREMTFATSASTARARASSGAMMEKGLGMGAGGMHRGDSYATLLHSPQAQMSRHPSYYASYPIATPSTLNGSPPDSSPEVYPVEYAAVLSAMSGSTSVPYAASASGRSTPGLGSGSDEQAQPVARNSRRISSVDRLRMEALSVAGRSSPTSPSMQFPSPHPAHYPVPEHSAMQGNTTPPSPMYMQSPSGNSSSPILGSGSYPRPGSMSSLSSRGYNYLHVGPARGAPHQGRPIQLEMPRLLSAEGGESPNSPLSQSAEWGQARMSGGFSTPNEYLPNPYPQSPPRALQHRRTSSANSLSGMSLQGRPRTSGSYQPALSSMPGQQQERR